MQHLCRTHQQTSQWSALLRLLAALLILPAPMAYCGTVIAQMQLQDIEHAIERPIPTIDDALGYKSAHDASGRYLVVGAFDETGSSKDNRVVGSQALAFYLSALLQGQCGQLSVEPAYLLGIDSRGDYREAYPGAATVNERLLQRLNPDLLLHGHISQSLDAFTISLKILNRRVGETTTVATVEGAATTLDESLAAVGQSIVSAFCPNSTVNPEAPGNLTALGRIWPSASPAVEPTLAALRMAFDTGLGGYPLALAYLTQLWGGPDTDKITAASNAALQRFPSSFGIKLLANYLLIVGAPRSADIAAFERLRATCATVPNDFSCRLVLLDAYRVEKLMYYSPQGDMGTIKVISSAIEHDEGTARAIVLGIDLVERYPNNFRSQFHLAMSLAKYASLVRGTAYLRNLSADQQRRYSAIQEQAAVGLRAAQKMHSQHPWIYEEMMGNRTMSREGDMELFRRASSLSPHRASIYQTAYNYARPQWGGNKAMLREIYETSKRNNPGQQWPDNLRAIWAKELTFWRMDSIIAWLCFAGILGALLAAGWFWRARR